MEPTQIYIYVFLHREAHLYDVSMVEYNEHTNKIVLVYN